MGQKRTGRKKRKKLGKIACNFWRKRKKANGPGAIFVRELLRPY